MSPARTPSLSWGGGDVHTPWMGENGFAFGFHRENTYFPKISNVFHAFGASEKSPRFELRSMRYIHISVTHVLRDTQTWLQNIKCGVWPHHGARG